MPKIISFEKQERKYRKRIVREADFFVSETAVGKMVNHADAGFVDGKEVLGLILGEVYRDEYGEYAVADGVATSKLNSTETSVKFDPEGFEELFASMDETGGSIVGWYHSHPGFGCYMSQTDIETHVSMFGNGTGFAIVIDPSDGTFMAFATEDGMQKDVRMIVCEE